MTRNQKNGIHIIDCNVMGLPGFTASFVIEDERTAIIDTGTKDSSDILTAWFNEKGLKPDIAVITHVHHDHIGGLYALKEEFPDMEITASPLCAERLLRPTEENSAYTDVTFAPVEGVRPVREGEKIPLGEKILQVLDTPGHCEDHISLYETQTAHLFPGDLLGDWCWGNTYLPPFFSYDFDEEKFLASLKKIEALSPASVAMHHYGFFDGKSIDFLYKNQLQHYYIWRDLLVKAWKEEPSHLSFIPYMMHFFEGSPFEDNEALAETVSSWCCNALKNSGIIG